MAAGARRARFVLIVAAIVLCAAPLRAQGIVDGRRLEFLPSADDSLVQDYSVNVYVAGSSTVYSTASLGKPTPDSDGYIRVAFVPLLSTALQLGVTYEARVAANGTGGSSLSDVSSTFALTSACGTSTISTSSVSVGAGATTGSLGVTSTCAWSSLVSGSWITVTSGASGNSSGTLKYSVAANGTSSPRTGTINVAGNTFTITQAAGCSYSLSSASQSLTAAGGTGTVTLNTGGSCSWTAVSNATAWLTVTSGASGTGSGSVGFSAAAYNGASPRSGTLTIGGQTFTVTESACAFTVSPSAINATAAAVSGTLTVTTTSACGWTAIGSAGWVTLGSGRTGSGTVSYALTANTTTLPRSTNLTVAGQSIAVKQDAPVVLAPPTNLRIIR
jgi:hypothetical protein